MNDLLETICCPETRQALTIAEPAVIAQINERIRRGEQTNRRGKPVAEPIDAGYIRQDGKFLYPVRGKIPVLLIDEAIPLQP